MTIHNRQRLLPIPFAPLVFALGLGSASGLMAQEAAQQSDTAPKQTVADMKAPPEQTPPVVRTTVTGSNIRRVQPPPTLPLLDIDRDYIDRSGTTTPIELLRTIPQMQNFGAPAVLPGGTRR